jgi:hypothetical protein
MPALTQFGSDGSMAFRTPQQFEVGKAFLHQDLLCEQNDGMLGRPRCGPVYHSSKGGEQPFEYVYVNPIKLLKFNVSSQ